MNILGVILLVLGLTLIAVGSVVAAGTVIAIVGTTRRTPGGRKYGTDRKYRH